MMMSVIEPSVLLGGRYEVGPVIGRGGMAEVRGGLDTRLDRPVAIKVLRPELAHDPAVRARFEAEARLAARLVHPAVVAVFDSGEAEGVPFIVMERLPGQTLRDRLAAGPLSEADGRAMAVQVLSALRAAHEAGILHRDIKPGNVLAAPGGSWKVGDFGIAKALEVDRSDQTATGLLIGTPAYLAPERFLGSPATVASDLYSVGVVLFEALAGRKPFAGDQSDGWAAAASGFSAPPLQQYRPDVDPVLAAAVDRCLRRDPAARFASAAAMEAALDGGTATAWGAPIGPAPTEVLDDRVRPGWSSARPATAVLPLRDRIQRRPSRGAVMAAVVALVAVIVILGVTLSGGGGSSRGSHPPATTVPAGAGAASTAGLPSGLSRALDNLRHQVTRGR